MRALSILRGAAPAPAALTLALPVNTLYFTAGPGNEAHGAYGRITTATIQKGSP